MILIRRHDSPREPWQCLKCGIRKLDQTQTFCNVCTRMLFSVLRRPYFVRLSEEWHAEQLERTR